MVERVTRRLSAILAADVAGYSRMMSLDEEGTLSILKQHLRNLIEPLIDQHRGRVVKYMGDGLIAEFASAVDAVSCAVEVQRGMKCRNAEVPLSKRMEFRIGINVGDIIVDGDDIYGDGVNIAARLETLSASGSICVSRSVRDAVRDKLSFQFEDAGEQTVKNITRPVHAYRVRHEVHAVLEPLPAASMPPQGDVRRELTRIGLPVLILVGVLGIGIGVFTFVEKRFLNHNNASLAAKPKIAVLPFVNLSGDPTQEYLSDGIADEILTGLARSHAFTVIGRHSSYTFKGQSVNPTEVGKVLNVRYVLQGSVQKSVDQLRITAQLVNTADGAHIWAEKYDRPLRDIFLVQDEIAGAITARLTSSIQATEAVASVHKHSNDLDAYDYYLQGRALVQTSGKQATLDARYLFDRATQIDPGFAPAFAELAYTYYVSIALRWELPPRAEALAKGLPLAQRAAALDPALPIASLVMGDLLLRLGDHEQAVLWARKAIDLDDSNPEAYAALANIFAFVNRNEEAIPLLEKALALDPLYPPLYSMYRGRASLFLQKADEALPFLRDCEIRAPDFWFCHVLLASAYAHVSRLDLASAELEEVRRYYPVQSLAQFRREGDYHPGPEYDFFASGLIKAGLPREDPM